MLDLHSLIYAFDNIFLTKMDVDTRALILLDEEEFFKNN